VLFSEYVISYGGSPVNSIGNIAPSAFFTEVHPLILAVGFNRSYLYVDEVVVPIVSLYSMDEDELMSIENSNG